MGLPLCDHAQLGGLAGMIAGDPERRAGRGQGLRSRLDAPAPPRQPHLFPLRRPRSVIPHRGRMILIPPQPSQHVGPSLTQAGKTQVPFTYSALAWLHTGIALEELVWCGEAGSRRDRGPLFPNRRASGVDPVHFSAFRGGAVCSILHGSVCTQFTHWQSPGNTECSGTPRDVSLESILLREA